jgi:hypothetical protein
MFKCVASLARGNYYGKVMIIGVVFHAVPSLLQRDQS